MSKRLAICPMCLCFVRADTFEPVDCWPHSVACAWCAAELRADELDAREPECCASGCHICTGERSYAGF